MFFSLATLALLLSQSFLVPSLLHPPCARVRPSVCLPVTSRCSVKTSKHRITQITPYNSSGTLVFLFQRSW